MKRVRVKRPAATLSALPEEEEREDEEEEQGEEGRGEGRYEEITKMAATPPTTNSETSSGYDTKTAVAPSPVAHAPSPAASLGFAVGSKGSP